MPDYAQMTQLTKVSVELEDCFGVGIYRFLRMVGHQLTELSLSCSSGKLNFLGMGDKHFINLISNDKNQYGNLMNIICI